MQRIITTIHVRHNNPTGGNNRGNEAYSKHIVTIKAIIGQDKTNTIYENATCFIDKTERVHD